MKLRPYQQEALEAVRESYRQGHRRSLVVMPTGTGKTVLFAEISRLAKGPVLVLAHRQELVEQAREKISAWCDDVVAVEMADRRELTKASGKAHKITVASIQSMRRRLTQVPRDTFRIVVIDEAHHSTADSYRELIDHFDAHILGVTATPDRSDRQPLGDIFTDLAFNYDILTAIAEGWLCPIRSFLVKTEVDFSGIRKIAGELAIGDVEEILTQEPHLAEIAYPIVNERDGRPTMVFAASVAHAHALARVLCEFSQDDNYAVALDGSHPTETRRKVIAGFRAGEIKVLVNCSLFTEGFDVPQISMVAIARPVLSRAFYAQMVGRGTRIAPDKKDLLVLDYLPANCRHQLIQSVDIFAKADEEVLEIARKIAAQLSEEGQAMALEQILELAQQEHEARESTVDYQLLKRDMFTAIKFDEDGAIRRRPKTNPVSQEQETYLAKAGFSKSQIIELDARQAYELQEHLITRKTVGMSSPKQVKKLADWKIDASNFFFEHAKGMLEDIREDKKLMPIEELRAKYAAIGRRLFNDQHRE